jgi:PHS family inorganic phosphate transporter-like MFS transporter
MVDYKEEQTSENIGITKTSMLIGAVLGQLIFGAVGDSMGRKPAFVITCTLCIVGCLGSAMVVDSPVYGVYTQLAAWRFILGLGVGGEYPLSSTITSESSSPATRGRNLALVFSMQGFGRLLCNLVLIVLLQNDATAYDFNWRMALALGALPAVVAFYFRITMNETESFAAEQNEPTLSTSQAVSQNSMLLLGTAGAWFILDVTFYGNSLFSGDVTQAMGVAETPLDEAWQNLYINLIALPGYILAVLFMDTVGRARLQVLGFVGVGAIFFILSMFATRLAAYEGAYLILYALTFLFMDFGPNTTTFVISATVFPTSARATCAGISAAAGKLGAVAGGMLFKPIEESAGIGMVFTACATVCIVGAAWTVAFVSDRESSSLASGPVEYVGDKDEEQMLTE